MGYDLMMGWGGAWGGFGAFMFLFWAALFALVVLAIVYLWMQITKK
ncbi:MAG: hypothetical protein Q8Q41_01550 [bacterium]|nr:hypothetical protein [bacterium]